MKPLYLYQPTIKDSVIRRFANCCDIHEVLLLHEADYKGRKNITDDFEKKKKWFHKKHQIFHLIKK